MRTREEMEVVRAVMQLGEQVTLTKEGDAHLVSFAGLVVARVQHEELGDGTWHAGGVAEFMFNFDESAGRFGLLRTWPYQLQAALTLYFHEAGEPE